MYDPNIGRGTDGEFISEDTETFGVGPWTLDVTMARRLGYTEIEIRNMCNTLAANSRAYNGVLEARRYLPAGLKIRN